MHCFDESGFTIQRNLTYKSDIMASKNTQLYIDHYEAFIDNSVAKSKQENSGGKIRANNAKLVESLAELIWKTETQGSVRKESYTISNPQGDKLDFSVDKHCYSINGELKLVLECKTYLDRCFLSRADHDMNMIKSSLAKNNRGVEFSILALENACAESALEFYKGWDNIDDIFFLLDGRRTSNKPIWDKDYRKPINIQSLDRFIDYVEKLK